MKKCVEQTHNHYVSAFDKSHSIQFWPSGRIVGPVSIISLQVSPIPKTHDPRSAETVKNGPVVPSPILVKIVDDQSLVVIISYNHAQVEKDSTLKQLYTCSFTLCSDCFWYDHSSYAIFVINIIVTYSHFYVRSLKCDREGR